jgi:hypothetical protein
METDNWEKVDEALEYGQETLKSRKAGHNIQNNLTNQIRFRERKQLWGTPKEQDSRAAYNDRGKSNLGEQVHGVENVIEMGGQLNPMWVEWLMGFPLGWTDLKHSETP